MQSPAALSALPPASSWCGENRLESLDLSAQVIALLGEILQPFGALDAQEILRCLQLGLVVLLAFQLAVTVSDELLQQSDAVEGCLEISGGLSEACSGLDQAFF